MQAFSLPRGSHLAFLRCIWRFAPHGDAELVEFGTHDCSLSSRAESRCLGDSKTPQQVRCEEGGRMCFGKLEEIRGLICNFFWGPSRIIGV